jgi:hypothetical protein
MLKVGDFIIPNISLLKKESYKGYLLKEGVSFENYLKMIENKKRKIIEITDECYNTYYCKMVGKGYSVEEGLFFLENEINNYKQLELEF